MHIKFEVSNFIRSKGMTGSPKFRNGSRDPDPFGGLLVNTRLILHVANSCKNEFASFSHSTDISGRVTFLNGACDPDHALFTDDFHRQAGTCCSRPM